MGTENKEKNIKSLGFTLKIKENKKEVKKNALFDAKNFRKPFEEDVIYNDDIKVKEELIKEVEGKKIHAVNEIEEKGPLVIPLIKTNQWRNQDGTLSSNDTNNNALKSESEKASLDKDQKDITNSHRDENEQEEVTHKIDLTNQYGLQIPTKKRKLNEPGEDNGTAVAVTKVDPIEKEVESEKEDHRTLEEKAIDALKKEAEEGMALDAGTANAIDAIPILKQNAVPGTENLKSETEKFRYDIQFRPEESTLEDYERIPIEEFGAAMLRGMGWEKGKAVGRNRNKNNTMVEPIEFIPRPALLGLGAQPTPPDLEEMKKRRKRKMNGKDEPPPKEYKPNVTSDGRVKHFRTLDEPRKSRSSGNNNSSSSSSSRRHHRYSSQESNDKRDKSKYSKNDTKDDDDNDDDKDDDITYTHSYTHSRHSSSNEGRESKHHRHSSHHNHSRSRSRSRSRSHRPQNSWLYPNIRVRIVSKSFKSGKYYKKKGVVFDIARPGECTLRLDNGKLLEDVKEKYLETLIPEINEVVMVVRHTPYTDEDYYQKVGKVLSKDRETEKAMVQLVSTMEIVMLSFDDICEFKGNTNDYY